jgi:hypothetical protein
MSSGRQKRRPRVGDKVYRVEWVSKLAFYEDTDDVDHDNCTTSAKSFPFDQHDKARAFAEEIWPTTQQTFGIVEVDLMEFVAYDDDDAEEYPHAGFWECRETEIFSGEWEPTQRHEE